VDGQLQAAEFKVCLGAMGGGVTSEFPQVLFSAIDKDNSGTISFAEFVNWLLTMTHGTDEEKLRYGFDLCDQNKDGRIDKTDLTTTIEVSRTGGVEGVCVCVCVCACVRAWRARRDGVGWNWVRTRAACSLWLWLWLWLWLRPPPLPSFPPPHGPHHRTCSRC
jgi:hypothetical protein